MSLLPELVSNSFPLNNPLPQVCLPSTPLPPHSLPTSSSHPPPNLSSVMANLPSSQSTNSKTKDGLIRMLLQSNPVPQDQNERFMSRFSTNDRLSSLVQLDHCYSKPWNWKSESSLCHPTKTLFMPQVARNCDSGSDQSDYIDVVSDPVKPVPPYDPQQACKVMNECDRFVMFANPALDNNKEDEEDLMGWEEKLNKETWSTAKSKLFSKVMKVLNQDRLSRLALEGVDNEPVLRRVAVDRSARRMRTVLAAPPTTWDRVLVSWLHSTLSRHLPRPFLSAWLDILQTLKAKVPGLVDRLLAGAPGLHMENKTIQVTRDGLGVLLKRPWDPAASSLSRRRLGRLPGNPVLVVAPPGPADPRVMSRRMRLWNNQLGCMGKVIVINMPAGEIAGRTPVNQYLYQMVSATLTKVREIKSSTGGGERSVVLLGWGVGAAIAAHVGTKEKLAGLVCLGFPVSTLVGTRGQAGDCLLDMKSPVLFVVGDRASQSQSDDIEDLRERLPVETGLVIVGGADDNLRLSKRKKKSECVTQCMVDKCIMDEVRDFLSILLSSRSQDSPRFVMPSHESFLNLGGSPNKMVKARKRSSSTASSEGGPLSPVKRSPGISLTAGPQGTTPIHILPQNTIKKERKSKKSKSESSGGLSSPQSFSVLPASSLPPSLLSISTPLPSQQAPVSPAVRISSQQSPSLPSIRIPAVPLQHSQISPSVRMPAVYSPSSPTPRVIQFAGIQEPPKGHSRPSISVDTSQKQFPVNSDNLFLLNRPQYPAVTERQDVAQILAGMSGITTMAVTKNN